MCMLACARATTTCTTSSQATQRPFSYTNLRENRVFYTTVTQRPSRVHNVDFQKIFQGPYTTSLHNVPVQRP